MRNWRRAVWLGGAWIAATAVTAGVALAVVGLAGEQVADDPVEPLSARQVEDLGLAVPASSPAPAADPPAVASSTLPTPPDPSPSTTTTTIPAGSPATTAAPPTTAAPATTNAPPSSTTTTAPETQIDSRQITGGTVVVRWTAGSVELVSASPTDGFTVEVEKRGPDQVEVEFESETIRSRYKAEVSDGRLVVETSVDDEDDD